MSDPGKDLAKGRPDYILIISFFILIILGLIVLSSASYFTACQKFNDCYFYLKRQLMHGILPGLFLFFFFSFFNYQKLRKWALFCSILTILLLASVFVPGVGFSKDEAQRWVKLGVVFQPSEFAKLAFIIYLTAWLAKHKDKIKSFKEVFIPFVIFLTIISVLIILQPNLGTLVVVILTALAIYFMAGAPFYQFGLLAAASVPLIFFMIKIAPYRLNRLIAFLHPETDPLGIGYHLNQAILAVSSGRIFGRGLGYSFQKIFYLPEVVGDSIFAVMAEEFGFILILAVVGLYFYLAYRIFRLAFSTDRVFGKLLAGGIGFWFIFQTIVNMGAMLGILPLTGIPLPLISYGGSSFVVFCAAFGILVSISRGVDKNSTKFRIK